MERILECGRVDRKGSLGARAVNGWLVSTDQDRQQSNDVDVVWGEQGVLISEQFPFPHDLGRMKMISNVLGSLFFAKSNGENENHNMK